MKKASSSSNDLVGVTVVTPSYRHLEKQAVRSFKAMTGLPVVVIRAPDASGFTRKLELDRLIGRRRVLFFDVDTRVLQRIDLQGWNGAAWLAVHDPAVHIPHTFPHDDCPIMGMDATLYFNSGFFACDLRRLEHRQVFQMARRIHAKVSKGKLPKPVDWTDQVHLNLAVQRLGVPLNLLPFGFNLYLKAVQHGGYPFFPRCPTVIHAAGFELKDKARMLDAMEAVFGGERVAMQEGAIRHTHALQYELR